MLLSITFNLLQGSIMNNEDSKIQPIGRPSTGATSTAEDVLKKTADMGAETYAKAEKVVTDAYGKTADAVQKTYHQAEKFSVENPGTTILIAVGVGVGLGFLLGASYRRGGAGRFARPVVHALSDIASEYFR